MELKLAELRNGAVSNSNAQSSPEQRIQKSIRTTEYKLNRVSHEARYSQIPRKMNKMLNIMVCVIQNFINVCMCSLSRP